MATNTYNRYTVHTDGSFYAYDTVANRVVVATDGHPLVFSTAADATWYVGELHKLRTPAEILAGC